MFEGSPLVSISYLSTDHNLHPHLPALVAPRASKPPFPHATSSPEPGSILLLPLGAAGPSFGEINPQKIENSQQRMNKWKGFLTTLRVLCRLIAFMALSLKSSAWEMLFFSSFGVLCINNNRVISRRCCSGVARQGTKCSTGVCRKEIFFILLYREGKAREPRSPARIPALKGVTLAVPEGREGNLPPGLSGFAL